MGMNSAVLFASFDCLERDLQATEARAEAHVVQEDVVGQSLLVLNSRVGELFLFASNLKFLSPI
jgi:hypothetical protein